MRFVEKGIKWLAIAALVTGIVMVGAAVLAPSLGMGIVDDFWGYRLLGLHRRPFAVLGVRVIFWSSAALIAVVSWRFAGQFLVQRLSSRQFYRQCGVYAGKWALALSVFTLSFYVLLSAYDRLLSLSARSGAPDRPVLPGLDRELVQKSIRTLELHPYTGWHVQSNFTHNGPMPWEDSEGKEYTVKTGPLGFFIDFDLEHPPAKEPNEYRIIVIGGSGAQGWGAQTNEEMWYRLLEKRLNASFGSTARRFRVINMAMGSSITYQNYLALNRWGHALEPDLILSYSGRNDFFVPVYHEGVADNHYQFNELNTLVYAARGCEAGPRLRWLNELFPNVMNRTNLGVSLKFLVDYPHLSEQSKIGRRASRGLPTEDVGTMFHDRVVPFYIHALKSIKRDFQGVPVMVAWQALAPEEVQPWDDRLGDDFYNQMFERARQELEGYLNPAWFFLNVHHHFEAEPRPAGIRTHLTGEGHQLVADLIAREIGARVLGMTSIDAGAKGSKEE